MKGRWETEASSILKAELARRNVSYKMLSLQLAAINIDENPRQLTTKINRGTFSFIFFIQCMRVLSVDVVRLFDSELEAKKRRR